MPARDSNRVSTAFTSIVTNSVTINLTTHTKGPKIVEGNTTKIQGKLARRIVAVTNGMLVATRGDDTVVSITLVAGMTHDGLFKKIRPASSFSEIVVYW